MITLISVNKYQKRSILFGVDVGKMRMVGVAVFSDLMAANAK